MTSSEPANLKQWLEYTRKALKGVNGGEIWDIMCAMRGPDSGNHTEKMRTTEILRFVAFGESVPAGLANWRRGSLQDVVDGLKEIDNSFTSDHFRTHIRYAIEAFLKHSEIV